MTEDLRSAIEKHAKRIGANPADFATIISYETGGTFDPWKKGPTTKWGTHIGFIQMGDPQRKEFGYTEGKSVDELIGASADYLVANGYKPGMGLMDMYSTVNAGAPGRFNRSDYGNGGAPGTVADKVNYQMEGHKRKAVALLGGTYVPNITTPQDPVAWKEGAGTGNRQGYEFYKMGLPDSSGYRYTAGVGDPGGTYSSLPTDAQSADTDYDGGLYPVDVTRRDQWVMDMNAKSQRGLPVNDVSYGDTYDAAYNKSWFGNQVDRLVKNWSFQNDPDWDREKELPKVLEKYPTDYWHRFSGVSSAEHAQWVEDQVSKEMQWDAKLQANGWTGFGSQMLFEMVNPLMLLGGVGAELTAAKMLGGAWKATRVARMGRSALLAGTGNVGSEMAMSLVDQQRRTSQDYALAFGAGAVLGGTFGIFTKGTSPVDLRINKEMQQLGKAIMQGQGNAGAAMSPATTMVENLPGGELKVEWGDMDAAREASFGRKLSNLISSVPGIRQLSNPMTKAEFLGSGPFNIVRSIIPDPRGVRNGEVLRETVGDRYQMFVDAQHRDWKIMAEPQFNKWAKRTLQGSDGMLNRMGLNDTPREKFFAQVVDYIENEDELTRASFDPEVASVAEHAIKMYERIGREAYDRGLFKSYKLTTDEEGNPLPEGETRTIEWEPNRFYNPYYKDDAKFLEINDKFGDLDVKEAVRKAFKEDFAEASDDLIAKLTDGYLNRLTKATLGIEDTARVAFSSADKAQIMAWLRDEAGITDQSLIDEFMNLPKFRGGDAGPRFKRRSFSLKAYNTKVKMRYREGYSGPRKNVTADNPDGWEEFSIRDFFVKNADDQMERYVREMSGALAFADLKITDPKTGELMVDGVKNDADWVKVKNLIQTLAVADNPRNAEAARDLVEELDYIHNALRKNGGDNPRMSKIGRRLNQTMFNVYMNNLGINSAQELSNTIATTSFYHAIKGVKPIKRMLDEAGKSVPIVPMIRDLEALVGVGHKRLLGSEHYVARMNRAGIENVSSKVGRGFDVVNGKVQAGVMKASGFEYIDNSLQVGAVNAMANTFVDMAQKYSKELEGGRFKMTDIDTIFAKDSRRLRSLGLDDKRLVGILNEIRKNYRVTDDGPDIQMDKWDNENASALRLALHRYYRRAIQQNDVGALSRWLQHPVAKVLLAFRSFIMVGMDKQFGYGLGHFDGRQAYQWLLNMTLAGSIWYLYQKATSLGQKDPKAYMERKFGEEGSYEFYRNLAIAGATRSGFTTVFPALYDTAAYFADLPRIDTRTSGQATAAWGAPFMSWLDTAARASSAAIKSVKEDRELSRQEINYIARTFNNNFLFIGLLNKATQDRAEFAPRNN